MAYKYLDQAGLRTVWDKIKQNFGLLDGISINGTLVEPTNKIANIPVFSNANTTSAGLVPPTASSSAIFLSGDGTWRTPPGTTSVATTAINGLMSYTDKIKLDSVASSAEVNQNAFSIVTALNGNNPAGIVTADQKTDTFALVGSGSVSLSVDNAASKIIITGTNTTYANATTDSDGLMSAADKQTLDNIVTTGGEPNQDAFSYIVVGGSTVAADDKKDTLTLVGAGSISLSATTGTDTITITGTDTTYTAGTGLTANGTTINHSNSITAGSVGSSVNNTSYTIPRIQYDSTGHIIGTTAIPLSLDDHFSVIKTVSTKGTGSTEYYNADQKNS